MYNNYKFINSIQFEINYLHDNVWKSRCSISNTNMLTKNCAAFLVCFSVTWRQTLHIIQHFPPHHPPPVLTLPSPVLTLPSLLSSRVPQLYYRGPFGSKYGMLSRNLSFEWHFVLLIPNSSSSVVARRQTNPKLKAFSPQLKHSNNFGCVVQCFWVS